MRIIAIGIGGAGCRIVDSLFAIDRRSSKIACVQGLAIDVDEETMKRLTALPENSRMCFTADVGIPDPSGHTEQQAAPIDINEIISRVQNLESGENDAILICCGLGGGMADVAPHIIAGLRSSIVEPIFGLVTLPCLAEGKRISGKAADDIDMLSSLLDGIIVFDNETWHKKIKTQRHHIRKKEKGFAEKIGLIKGEKPLPPEQVTYRNLNEVIVRRIGLILRAGEFRADGGIDLAEVVLDSGEVLNTMKGMGFITIGYAVEKLPNDPLRFLSWLKPAGLSDEEQKKRASRIVELAKQAIYHEISTPCDLTSAHKALVLIAGPSHELSMKGFMTVRKWIDRSIAGLETRSGDYPVMTTNNVAIIVMLSGLENIPRITELHEIRSESKPGKQVERAAEIPAESEATDLKTVRDDMISLPSRRGRDDGSSRKSYREPAAPEEFTPPVTVPEPEPLTAMMTDTEMQTPPVIPELYRQSPSRRPVMEPEHMTEQEDHSNVQEATIPARRRVIVTHAEKDTALRLPSQGMHGTGSPRPEQKPDIAGRHPPATGANHHDEIGPRSKETDRQRIERELRRQRSVAIGGHASKTATQPPKKDHDTSGKTHVIRRSHTYEREVVEEEIPLQEAEPVGVSGERRTVIIGKRKTPAAVPLEEPVPESDNAVPVSFEEHEDDGMNVEIRDRVFKARDDIFTGKGVRKSTLPRARDSTLLHTNLKARKKAEEEIVENEETVPEREEHDPVTAKKRIRGERKP